MLYAITVVDEQAALAVKFGIQVRVSSIDNSKFLLYTTDATPALIADPFEEIDTYKDFHSISRVLYLRFKEALVAGDYTLVVTGLENPAGNVQSDTSLDFTIDTDVVIAEPVADVVTIQDHSIITGSEIESLIIASNPTTHDTDDLYVVSTDPADDEYFLETDYNDGRITVVFSRRPNVEELTSEFIKVQRKAAGLAPTRWESVDATFSLDGSRPWVYIQLPEVDDGVFFQVGFKYRIRIKGTLGAD